MVIYIMEGYVKYSSGIEWLHIVYGIALKDQTGILNGIWKAFISFHLKSLVFRPLYTSSAHKDKMYKNSYMELLVIYKVVPLERSKWNENELFHYCLGIIINVLDATMIGTGFPDRIS